MPDVEPLCKKKVMIMIGLEKTIMYKKGGPSGTNGDKDLLFLQLDVLYKEMNGSHSCALYRPAWEYLRAKARFCSYMDNSVQADKTSINKRRGKRLWYHQQPQVITILGRSLTT